MKRKVSAANLSIAITFLLILLSFGFGYLSKRKLPFLFIIRFIPNFVSMKRKVSAANLSIAITFLLILLSFGFGYRSYSQAEQRVVSDLNQALQRTVLQNKGLWLNADTIQTYAKLQEVMGTPVSVSGFHRAFTEALSITGLKDVSTLSLHILKKNAPAAVFNEIPAGCLVSDTLVWLSTTADASGLTLSFRGYARCSAAMLFSLSKQTIPATLLLAALLWGGFTFFYFHRHTKTNASNGQQQENFITFGNLSLSLQEACFYNEQQEKLKLTPMQYTLISATFRFPSRKPASITNSRKS